MRLLKRVFPFVLAVIVGTTLYRNMIPRSGFLTHDCIGCHDGKLSPPRILVQPPMRLTEAARAAGAKGVIRLRIKLDSFGIDSEVQRLQGMPYGLTSEAELAAKAIQFEPAVINGETTWSNIEIEYKVDAASNKIESQYWFETEPPTILIPLSPKNHG